MVNSTKYSFFILRIGLAIVFFWFGVDKILDPTYWVNAWTTGWMINIVDRIGITPDQLMYVVGIFEILLGLSLVTKVLLRIFAFLGMIFLAINVIAFGFSEVMIRDIGLLAGLLAVVLWPERDN
ncbi:MAG: DoxX family protein [Parcubacteria group bacterium]